MGKIITDGVGFGRVDATDPVRFQSYRSLESLSKFTQIIMSVSSLRNSSFRFQCYRLTGCNSRRRMKEKDAHGAS